MPTTCVSLTKKLKETVILIESAISTIGGSRLYFVGGFVRDRVLEKDIGDADFVERESKDVDFVVCEMPFNSNQVSEALDAIVSALSTIPNSKVKEVGKSFGVVKATINGEEFDFAIPRMSESKIGNGHADFIVEMDPSASIETDLSRRDFTMNAMALTMDLQIIDPFGGIRDIENTVIRTVGKPYDRFMEDPLRILRGLQFASRLDFSIDEETFCEMKKLAGTVLTISGERIYEEFKKAFSEVFCFSFIHMLMTTGIGNLLFGSNFYPREVIFVPPPRRDRKDESVDIRFVAMFLFGGDYTVLKLPTRTIQMIELGRNMHSNKKEPWEYIGSLDGEFEMLYFVMRERRDLFFKMERLPITSKKLAVSGGELMEHGLKGKEIGKAQKMFLSLIWNGKLSNKKKSLLDYLDANINLVREVDV